MSNEIKLLDVAKLVGFTTAKEVVDDAVNFYMWAIGVLRNGNLVGEMKAGGEFTQILTEGLAKFREGIFKEEEKKADEPDHT